MPDAKKIPLRSEISSEHQWDLTPLFETDQAWEKRFVEIAGQLDGYEKFKGHLLESPERLAQGLAFHLQLSGPWTIFTPTPT